MNTVSTPPSTSVTCTSSTESRMKMERSTTVRRRMWAGSSCVDLADGCARSRRPPPPCWRRIASPHRATDPGRPSISEALRRSSIPSTTRATWAGRSARRRGTPRSGGRKPSTDRNLPATRTSGSCRPCSSLPAGTSMFSRCSACDHLRVRQAVSPAAFRCPRRPGSRGGPARPCSPALPRHGFEALLDHLLGKRRERLDIGAGLSTAIERIGMALKSMRWITGSFMSLGKSARMALILACASCWAVCDARAEPELDHDGGEPLGGGGADVADAGDGVQRLLDALGDLAFDGLGRRPGVEGLDRQNGDLDVRKLVDGELPVREEAERHQRDGHMVASTGCLMERSLRNMGYSRSC